MAVLTKAQAGTGTEAHIGILVDGMELWGPDLRLLPPLADQLARLDAALSDPDHYAEEWLAVQAELADKNARRGAELVWGNDDAEDAEPVLYFGGVSCDDQEPERRLRSGAISDHLPDDPPYRHAIRRLLIARGHYIDNRRTSRAAIFAAMRQAIAMRAQIMVSPRGSLEVADGWPAARDDDRSEKDLDDAYIALTTIVRLMRRWRAANVIARAVRIAGRPVSGFMVLEARS